MEVIKVCGRRVAVLGDTSGKVPLRSRLKGELTEEKDGVLKLSGKSLRPGNLGLL